MATLMTAEEYLNADDPRPHMQLINGEIVLNSPVVRHQRLAVFLVLEIGTWCRLGSGRGECAYENDVVIDGHNVYAPDVWWVDEAHRPARDAKLLPMPQLVAEVRSESTWRHDVGTKLRRYEANGLGELWLVDTKSDSVLVFRRSSPGVAEFDVSLELVAGDALTSPQLPGLSISISDLFDR